MNQNVKAAAIVDAVPGITSLTPDEASGLFLMGTLAMGVYADAPSLLHLVGKWNTGSLNNRGDLIGAVPYDDKMARATSTASGASTASAASASGASASGAAADSTADSAIPNTWTKHHTRISTSSDGASLVWTITAGDTTFIAVRGVEEGADWWGGPTGLSALSSFHNVEEVPGPGEPSAKEEAQGSVKPSPKLGTGELSPSRYNSVKPKMWPADDSSDGFRFQVHDLLYYYHGT